MVLHKGIEYFCFRCKVKVYPVDKIGPLKGAFFHNQCFKCRVCGLVLNMKNFIQNQLDPDDKEVYCNIHVPKYFAGNLGGDAIGIRSALQAPKKAGFCNEQIRGSDKYNPDTHAIEIQNALTNLKNTKLDSEIIYNPKKWKNKKPFHNNVEEILGCDDIPYKGYEQNGNEELNSTDSNSSPRYMNKNLKAHQSVTSYSNNKTYSHHKCLINGSHLTDSPSPSDDTMDYENQINLEKRLRVEEDEMYATFAKLRLEEERKLEVRFKDELLLALNELRNKFAKLQQQQSSLYNGRNHGSRGDDSSISSSSSPLMPAPPALHLQQQHQTSSTTKWATSESDYPVKTISSPSNHDLTDKSDKTIKDLMKEERELERRLTIKREREKDALSRKLIEYERNEASKLIEKHADEMLKFTTLKRSALGRKRGNRTESYNFNQDGLPALFNERPSNENNHNSKHHMNESQQDPLPPFYETQNNSISHYSNNHHHHHTNNNQSGEYYPNAVAEMKKDDNVDGAAYKKGSNDTGISSNHILPGCHYLGGGGVIAEAPPPGPPKYAKCQIYNDPAIFEEIDQRAINVASTIQNSFTDLVRQLTRHCNTDVQKARALFRWITIKNLNIMTFDKDVASDSPMGLLRGIKLGTESYHMLFKRLCSYAGLHCVVIRGYSKSAGYLPGMKFELNFNDPSSSSSSSSNQLDNYLSNNNHVNDWNGNSPHPVNSISKRFRNTWNAAYLDGSWRFVQCNWGARHLVNNSSSQTTSTNGTNSNDMDINSGAINKLPAENGNSSPSNDNLRYEYDDHYFLTDPEQFIYEFYPKQPEWQLLTHPITLWQFENLPFVRSLFFKYGLSFVDAPYKSSGLASISPDHKLPTYLPSGTTPAVLEADNTGAANLTIRMPASLISSLVFHYNFRFYNVPSLNGTNGATPSDSMDGINMRRYVMQTLVGNNIVFKVHCPNRGEFLLDVFANQVKAADYASGRAMRFKSVCKSKIDCRILEKIMIPLPDCASGEWGPVKAYKLFSMIPVTHEDAVINTHSDSLVIKFKFAPHFSPTNKVGLNHNYMPHESPLSPTRSSSGNNHSYNGNAHKKLVDFAAALHKNDFETPIDNPNRKTDENNPKMNALSKCVTPKWCFKVTPSYNGMSSSPIQNVKLPNSNIPGWNESVEGIKFEINLPEEGQYGLDIYAREELIDTTDARVRNGGGWKEKQLLTHACKYLINYRLV